MRQESGESAQSQRPPHKQPKIDIAIRNATAIRNAIAGITVDEAHIRERQKAKAECEKKAIELEKAKVNHETKAKQLEEQARVAREQAKLAQEQAESSRDQAQQHQVYLTNARKAKRELLMLQLQLHDLEDDGVNDLEDDGLCEEAPGHDGL